MNNKKGISAIVATVLIILITVAAVTIIWAAIIPMINSQLDRGTVCLDAVSQVSILDKGYTCKDVVADEIKIQVKRGALDFTLDDLQILVNAGGSTTSYAVIANTLGSLPLRNEERVYTIDVGVGNAAGVESVSIAPVVQIGAAKESCDVSATRVLPVCA